MPLDLFFTKRIYEFLKYFNIADCLIEWALNLKIDHQKYGLKPKHRALNAHPTINDAIPLSILSGKVVVKQSIERFTKNGVIFEGEKQATLIDDVVLATGYEIKYDFLSEEITKV